MGRSFVLRLLESFFRHPILNLLPFILLTVAAVVYVRITPPVYQSSGTMYVTRSTLLNTLTTGDTSYSWTTPAQATVSDLQGLVQTDAFVRSAIQRTNIEQQMNSGPEQVAEIFTDFRTAITIRAVGDNLVQVTARHKDAETARQIAKGLFEVYTQWKLNSDNVDSQVAQQFFSDLIKPYEADQERARNALTEYLTENPPPVRGERPPDEEAQIKLLQENLDNASARLNSAVERQEDARLARARAESEVRQNYVVVDEPVTPDRPAARLLDRARDGAPFVVVGLLLSIISIVGGAVLDRTLRYGYDVQQQLGLNTLAVVPRMLPNKRERGGTTASTPTTDAPNVPNTANSDLSATVSTTETSQAR